MSPKREGDPLPLGPWRGEQVPRYGRDRKALSPAVLQILNGVQSQILHDPFLGDEKRGQLRRVRVEKFKAENDQYLLAYTVIEKSRTVRFLAVGQHENFYRDLSKYIAARRDALRE